MAKDTLKILVQIPHQSAIRHFVCFSEAEVIERAYDRGFFIYNTWTLSDWLEEFEGDEMPEGMEAVFDNSETCVEVQTSANDYEVQYYTVLEAPTEYGAAIEALAYDLQSLEVFEIEEAIDYINVGTHHAGVSGELKKALKDWTNG